MVYYVPLVWVSCEFDSHCGLPMSLKAVLIVAVLFFILVPILSGEEQALDSDDDSETHTEDD